MPITFESIQDPYGIASAGTLLGQMLFRKKEQERDLANKLAVQKMKGELKLQQGQQLAALLGLGDFGQTPMVPVSQVMPTERQMGSNMQELPTTREPLPSFSLSPLQDQAMGLDSAALRVSPTNQTMLAGAMEQPELQMAARTQPMVAPMNQAQQGQDALTNIDPRRLALAATMYPAEVGPMVNLYQTAMSNKIAQENRDWERRNKIVEQERDYNKKAADESKARIEGLRQSLEGKRAALAASRTAIESGDVGALSMNNLAEIFHRPELMTASGAALTLAGKESILSNMSKVSAKGQNQWFEQRLAQMFPMIGRSKYANMTFQVFLEGELARDQAYLTAWDKLAEQDRAKFGYVKEDIDSRVQKLIEPTDKRIMREASYKSRQILEQEKGDKWLTENVNKKVPSGTMLTYPMRKVLVNRFKGDWAAALRYAKGLGYDIPTREEVEQWQ